MAVIHHKSKTAGQAMKNEFINKFLLATVILAIVAIVVIGGCAKQAQSPLPLATQQSATEPARTVEQPVAPPQQAQQAEAEKAGTDEDVYNDNLNQSIEELSQLE